MATSAHSQYGKLTGYFTILGPSHVDQIIYKCIANVCQVCRLYTLYRQY